MWSRYSARGQDQGRASTAVAAACFRARLAGVEHVTAHSGRVELASELTSVDATGGLVNRTPRYQTPTRLGGIQTGGPSLGGHGLNGGSIPSLEHTAIINHSIFQR